jgi:hypothetical protein
MFIDRGHAGRISVFVLMIALSGAVTAQSEGQTVQANGAFDFDSLGTWTWNRAAGWTQVDTRDPLLLEAWNGNFVAVYNHVHDDAVAPHDDNGTWLWNGVTQTWTLLSAGIPTQLKACGDQLLWANVTAGTWRWNASAGWAQLSPNTPEGLECFGGDAVWEAAAGTWIYRFSTGAWSQLSAGNPTGVLACGSRLVWWRAPSLEEDAVGRFHADHHLDAGDTWYWEAASGWHNVAPGPESTACYRSQLVWKAEAGTWVFDFNTSVWTQITTGNPKEMVSWGPNLAWESADAGTWVWNGTFWSQISRNTPTEMAVLGADLLWTSPAGTWVWGGGGGGAGWTKISDSMATAIVSTVP